ncbi:PilN lipoprotein [Salmonella enterica subsp. enterica serovar Typhi str. P-stx-12]|nr:PilN lipoprotein [Salmonella enterica subsp. enterica serovar Typhi str. P-stx-12]
MWSTSIRKIFNDKKILQSQAPYCSYSHRRRTFAAGLYFSGNGQDVAQCASQR